MRNAIIATLLLLSTNAAIADDYAMGDSRHRREYPNENFSQRVREYDQHHRVQKEIREFNDRERERERHRRQYEREETGEYE